MSFFEFPHTRTYDSDLGWLIKDDKTQDELIEGIKEWIQNTQPTITDLHNLYEQIMSGNLPEGMKEGIREWMEENALDLVGELVKMVFFGLTDDGHFVAYIPQSWDDVIFGTSGLDDFPAGVEYGHLTLSLIIGG